MSRRPLVALDWVETFTQAEIVIWPVRLRAAGLPRVTDWFVPLNCRAVPLLVGPVIHVGLLTSVPLLWLAVLSGATVPEPSLNNQLPTSVSSRRSSKVSIPSLVE